MEIIHRVLLKMRPTPEVNWRAGLAGLAQTLGFAIDACCEAVSDGELYCYLSAPNAGRRIASASEAYAALAFAGGESSANPIVVLIGKEGATRGSAPLFHYVVETDVEPEHEEDLNDWYNNEHLPGLAAVPGCIAATRYRNMLHSPRYIAAYDLISPDVLERPEWLAVRNTPWSARVRPHLFNTKRTLFRHLPVA
jgi:hypothetical protein